MPHLTVSKASITPYLLAEDAKKITRRENLNDRHINATSSEIDPVFAVCRKKLIALDEKIADSPKKKDKRKFKMRKDAIMQNLQDWDYVLKKSKPSIEVHLEKRIHLVFMQAVCCYKTKFTFREGHTLHQGFNAKHIDEVEFNAAHHGTLPNLYCSDDSDDDDDEKVFLLYSGIYDESNATMGLVKPVNDADRAIDEKRTTSLLRDKTIRLLNKAAQGEITPTEVAKRFIKSLIYEINKAIKNEKKEVVSVLKIYLNIAEEIAESVKDPESFDLWMNLQLDNPALVNKELTNRELIKRKINDLAMVINSEGSIFYSFYPIYYRELLSLFKTEENRKVVEKAIGKTLQELNKEIEGFTKTKKATALVENHKDEIKALKKELLPIIAEKQHKEASEKFLDGVSENKKIRLRQPLQMLRFGMISADQEAQSRIKIILYDSLNKIKGGSRAHFFDDFFFNSILEATETEADRRAFAKLFNLSNELIQQVREVRVNQSAYKAINEFTSSLCTLSNEIREGEKTNKKKKLRTKINDIITQIDKSTKVATKTITTFCYRRLYDQMETKDEKRFLKELISCSRNSVDQDITLLPRKITTAEKKLDNNEKKIEKAVTEALKIVKDLRKKTNEFKGNLLFELRKAAGMNKAYFVAEYNKLYSPNPSMTQERLIDLENGECKITSKIAERVSQIFGVNPNLFFPSHFAE